MRRSRILVIVVLLLSSTCIFAQITNTVNIMADMSTLITGGFDPSSDSIMVQGLVWGEGLSDDDISGSRILMQDTEDLNLYKTTLTLVIPASTGLGVGDSLRWKFMAWPSDKFENYGWESGFDESYDGYPLIIEGDGAVIDFGPVQPKIKLKGEVVSAGGPQNTLHIRLDLSSIYGSGEGYFDPAIDYVTVQGFVWDDNSLLISPDSTRRLKQNLFEPGIIYETTIVVELDTAKTIGDSLRWKFKGNPDSRFANLGWEGSNGRYYVFQEDSAEVTLGPYTPYFYPLGPNLGYDVTILFQVDMNYQPLNYYDGSVIPVDLIEFIGVRGDHELFGGSVNGPFVPQDTLGGAMYALNDSGQRGDKVSGDNIWSRLITFPAGSASGGFTYKYGAYYPGCEDISSSKPMDNEGNAGQDHIGVIVETTEVKEILDIWSRYGEITAVEKISDIIPSSFQLEQNYPNPFNPSTVVRYSLEKATDVNLSVYNVLGEKVRVLIDTQQDAGVYEVTFDASNLASGVYFYRLSTPEQNITMKMMLLR